MSDDNKKKTFSVVPGLNMGLFAPEDLEAILKIINKYDSLGVVLNTDTSDGPGIHWFCLYCNFVVNPITLEYFNSSGNMPAPEVQAWLVKTKFDIENNINRKCEIVIASRIIHQQDSESECGNYSLYYIWSRLNGVSYKKFNDERIKDDVMIEFRETLFRNE